MENKYLAYVKAVGNYDGSATGGAYIILKGMIRIKSRRRHR